MEPELLLPLLVVVVVVAAAVVGVAGVAEEEAGETGEQEVGSGVEEEDLRVVCDARRRKPPLRLDGDFSMCFFSDSTAARATALDLLYASAISSAREGPSGGARRGFVGEIVRVAGEELGDP